MDYRTYPRRVPAEAGTPTLTPHSFDQLDMKPPLPDLYETAFFKKGEDRCVVRLSPFYRDGEIKDLYIVQDGKLERTYSEKEIQRWWPQIEPWEPSEIERMHIKLAEQGKQTYADAFRQIDVLAQDPALNASVAGEVRNG